MFGGPRRLIEGLHAQRDLARAAAQATYLELLPGLRFGEPAVDTQSGWHHFSVRVALGELPPAAVSVELYADAESGGHPFVWR